jgi:hypothetical protein
MLIQIWNLPNAAGDCRRYRMMKVMYIGIVIVALLMGICSHVENATNVGDCAFWPKLSLVLSWLLLLLISNTKQFF